MTEFIKVKRIEHGDEMVIPLEVHLQYPDLYPKAPEDIPVPVVEEVPVAEEVVVKAPVKLNNKKK